MNLPNADTLAMKVATGAQWIGGGTAFATGATHFLGLTPAQWSAVGVISGIVIGLLGVAVNAYFRHQHMKWLRSLPRAHPMQSE